MSDTYTRPPEVNILVSIFARLVLGLFGWRAVEGIPDIPKFVVVGAHHTSNADGFLMVFMAMALRIRLHWMGKHTLFKNPIIGALLRAAGGVSIDRTKRQNAVEQAVEAFAEHERFALVIAPDGTRKKAAGWKSGFYHIAQGAGVPIVLGYVDYKNKRAGLSKVIYPSGDIEADVALMRDFYATITPGHPERASEIVLLPPKAE